MLPYARETIAASERARLAAVGGGLGEVGRVSIGFTGASSHAAQCAQSIQELSSSWMA
jgi:hypothetical protein